MNQCNLGTGFGKGMSGIILNISSIDRWSLAAGGRNYWDKLGHIASRCSFEDFLREGIATNSQYTEPRIDIEEY